MAEAATKLPVKTENDSAPTPIHNWVAPFDSLRREIDRLFDDFRPFDFRFSSARSLFGVDPRKSQEGPYAIAPAMDLVEKDGEYEVTAELPGIDEKNVEISLSNRTLTVKGEKSEEKERKEKDYFLSERRYGSFHRSFPLPDSVDSEKVEATFSKGVLTIRLPKTAEAQKPAKKIEVKAA